MSAAPLEPITLLDLAVRALLGLLAIAFVSLVCWLVSGLSNQDGGR